MSSTTAALAAWHTPLSVRHQLANFVLLQVAWFVAVLSAAQHHNWPGVLAVVVVLSWHVYVAPKRLAEVKLILTVSALGLMIELINVHLGFLQAKAIFINNFPAPWLLALWALFAMSLNVTLRWLRTRPVIAALLGAIAGPIAYAGGVRLQAVEFLEVTSAVVSLAICWGIAMPLMLAIATRLDGFSTMTSHQPHAASMNAGVGVNDHE